MQGNEGSMLVNESRCLTAVPGISVEYRGHLGASLSCTTCIRIEDKGNEGLGPQENESFGFLLPQISLPSRETSTCLQGLSCFTVFGGSFYLRTIGVTMVKEWESVDLDPEPGEILTVWGLEVSEQNIEKYIHLGGNARAKFRGSGQVWGKGKDLGLLEESLLSTSHSAWSIDRSPYMQ